MTDLHDGDELAEVAAEAYGNGFAAGWGAHHERVSCPIHGHGTNPEPARHLRIDPRRVSGLDILADRMASTKGTEPHLGTVHFDLDRMFAKAAAADYDADSTPSERVKREAVELSTIEAATQVLGDARRTIAIQRTELDKMIKDAERSRVEIAKLTEERDEQHAVVTRATARAEQLAAALADAEREAADYRARLKATSDAYNGKANEAYDAAQAVDKLRTELATAANERDYLRAEVYGSVEWHNFEPQLDSDGEPPMIVAGNLRGQWRPATVTLANDITLKGIEVRIELIPNHETDRRGTGTRYTVTLPPEGIKPASAPATSAPIVDAAVRAAIYETTDLRVPTQPTEGVDS